MKNLALIAVMAAAVAVTACSKHEKVYAVDRVEEAQAAALQQAPQAEEVIFDDHGQPTFVELSAGATATTTTPAADAAAPAAATTPAADTAASADTAAPAEVPATQTAN